MPILHGPLATRRQANSAVPQATMSSSRPAKGAFMAKVATAAGFVSTTNNRSMIVKCKGAAPGSAIAPAAPAPAMAQQK